MIKVLVRGGGDLASGVILRMRRAGWQVLVTELAEPRMVRRAVSFAQAVYDEEVTIEDIRARRARSLQDAVDLLSGGIVPVLVDPQAEVRAVFDPQVLVDGRMRKLPPELGIHAAPLVVGLGPGFTAGENCHAVVETQRGPFLGRVYWRGPAQADTGIPEQVYGYLGERVLRAPRTGRFEPSAEIGQILREGEVVAQVEGDAIRAPFDGVLRGIMQRGLTVRAGEKVGDVDPRRDSRLCWMVSDKALAVGGGVLEAVLAWKAASQA